MWTCSSTNPPTTKIPSQVDVVLNEQSGRKSLSAISFPDPGAELLRSFGAEAMARPHKAIAYVRELLGRTHNPSGVYGPHFFPHSITVDVPVKASS